MNRRYCLAGLFAAGCFAATSLLVPTQGHAQANPRVQKAMELLKSMTAKLGAPKIQGTETVGGRSASVLYFGTTKIDNNFDVVDAIGKSDPGMTATLFAKTGEDYVRVSTSVQKPDGSGRAVGTILAGPALAAIKAGKPFYGTVPILGMNFTTGYEPIKDAAGNTIGIYYVGFKN